MRWAQRGKWEAVKLQLYPFVLLLHSLRAASQGLLCVLGNCICCQKIWYMGGKGGVLLPLLEGLGILE